jgi:hypothetical protein
MAPGVSWFCTVLAFQLSMKIEENFTFTVNLTYNLEQSMESCWHLPLSK